MEKPSTVINKTRKSTKVFILLSLLFVASIFIFLGILTLQEGAVSYYIATVRANETPVYKPLMPSLISFGVLLVVAAAWSVSFIVIMLRGAKKTVFKPMINDYAFLKDVLNIFHDKNNL